MNDIFKSMYFILLKTKIHSLTSELIDSQINRRKKAIFFLSTCLLANTAYVILFFSDLEPARELILGLVLLETYLCFKLNSSIKLYFSLMKLTSE